MNNEQLTDEELMLYLEQGDPDQLSCKDKARLIGLVKKSPSKILGFTKRPCATQVYPPKSWEGHKIKLVKVRKLYPDGDDEK